MSDEQLKTRLREIISEVTEVDDIPEDVPFKDLGIDSMMAIEIVAEVERTYQLSIPEEELQDLVDFPSVFAKVKRKLAERDAA